MTPDEYQRLALRTEKTPPIVDPVRNGDPSIPDARSTDRTLHAILGLCTETGELQDMVKKHLIYGKAFDPINVIEECGDVLWYLALALDASGYTLNDCMERNIRKLRARYPEGFTEAAALTRDLVAERAQLEGQTTAGMLSINWCGRRIGYSFGCKQCGAAPYHDCVKP